ncbi:hypothetical protein CW751_11620 [Brumimicrobium salinarum]|uniref:Uncharacterized protein n=1 Tax=Brumimicrobium salinarum TaxID=2058658 RepID=A0A2I0R0P1_9FLAO|nr:hypothetical protein CW751_11620 [Brumimicrobium salinarum]
MIDGLVFTGKVSDTHFKMKKCQSFLRGFILKVAGQLNVNRIIDHRHQCLTTFNGIDKLYLSLWS